MCVAAVPWCISSMLTMPVLGSPGCEWLLCLDALQACWQWLSLALQLVGGCYVSLHLKPADGAFLGFSECEWLAAFLSFTLSNDTYSWLFMDHIHHCLSECVCINFFWACSRCLCLVIQLVSAPHLLLKQQSDLLDKTRHTMSLPIIQNV